MFRLIERRLTYKPDSIDHGGLTNRPYRRVTLGLESGVDLDAAFIDHQSSNVILFLHGNSQNITKFSDHYDLFDAMGISYFIFDYPGFGKSTGKPSEASLYSSSKAAYSYVHSSLGFQPENIVIYGLSLGGAVAIELLQSVPARCLIVEATFTSSKDMARHLYPYLILRHFLPNRFRNVELLPKIKIPTLIIHGDSDEVVPISHAKQLYEIAADPKFFHEIKGANHTNCVPLSQPGIANSLKEYIESLQYRS